MNVVYDTNVILDVLLQRQPFDIESARIMNFVEAGSIGGYLCATTLTNIHYIVTRTYRVKQSLDGIQRLLRIFDIAPVNRIVLENAAQSKFADFEDAVLYESAKFMDADAIVTRNIRDFKLALLPVYTPRELSMIFVVLGSENE